MNPFTEIVKRFQALGPPQLTMNSLLASIWAIWIILAFWTSNHTLTKRIEALEAREQQISRMDDKRDPDKSTNATENIQHGHKVVLAAFALLVFLFLTGLGWFKFRVSDGERTICISLVTFFVSAIVSIICGVIFFEVWLNG